MLEDKNLKELMKILKKRELTIEDGLEAKIVAEKILTLYQTIFNSQKGAHLELGKEK